MIKELFNYISNCHMNKYMNYNNKNVFKVEFQKRIKLIVKFR